MKSPFKSPQSSRNQTLSQTATPQTKVNTFKKYFQQTSVLSLKKQISQLKKYSTQLEKIVSIKDMQFLYAKGMMELSHKKTKDVEAKLIQEKEEHKQTLEIKGEVQSKDKQEILSLKNEMELLKNCLVEFQEENRKLKDKIKQVLNQLQGQKMQAKSTIQRLIEQNLKDKQQYKLREQMNALKVQQWRKLEYERKEVNKFSRQQLYIIGRMEQLSQNISKYKDTQFVIQDNKQIEALRTQCKVNKLYYQSQINKLKCQIERKNESHKLELDEREKRVKADMMIKYQSKINLIPNLRNQIKILSTKLQQNQATIVYLKHQQFKRNLIVQGVGESTPGSNRKCLMQKELHWSQSC